MALKSFADHDQVLKGKYVNALMGRATSVRLMREGGKFHASSVHAQVTKSPAVFFGADRLHSAYVNKVLPRNDQIKIF